MTIWNDATSDEEMMFKEKQIVGDYLKLYNFFDRHDENLEMHKSNSGIRSAYKSDNFQKSLTMKTTSKPKEIKNEQDNTFSSCDIESPNGDHHTEKQSKKKKVKKRIHKPTPFSLDVRKEGSYNYLFN